MFFFKYTQNTLQGGSVAHMTTHEPEIYPPSRYSHEEFQKQLLEAITETLPEKKFARTVAKLHVAETRLQHKFIAISEVDFFYILKQYNNIRL